MESLETLYEERYGRRPLTVTPLTGSASPRLYYRLSSEVGSCIGTVGTDGFENQACIGLCRQFASKGIPVPEVYSVSEDGMSYLQEDLGDEILFDRYVKACKDGKGMEQVEDILCRTMSMLPVLQFAGAEGLDFNICHPQTEFTVRSAMFDLNYFKYCFLKSTGLEFHEMPLQDDFERFADDLITCGLPVKGKCDQVPTFLYRDFQARNVMLSGDDPCFIDFQGGRKGPIYYDVVSFIWQARARYPKELKTRMLEAYMDSLSRYIELDRKVFVENLRLFRLFRYLQVLGAYGFRGWTEHKANFVTSIPAAVEALSELLEEPFTRYPYLVEVLRRMLALDRFSAQKDYGGSLVVTVYSFSFKKGVPHDPSGNGGGYVFDCRSIHNPGRYEPYRKLTGMDEPVIRFLEDDGEVFSFMDHVYGVVEPHVETFSKRGFTNLMVSFGCTGGQHRSVYCAQHLAEHLAERYPDVVVRLIHREQSVSQLFNNHLSE